MAQKLLPFKGAMTKPKKNTLRYQAGTVFITVAPFLLVIPLLWGIIIPLLIVGGVLRWENPLGIWWRGIKSMWK